MTSEEWDQFYSENASAYWNRDEGDKPYQFLRYIESGETLLDVGTGLGKIPMIMKQARPNIQISVCDFSLEAIELAGKYDGFYECFHLDIFDHDVDRAMYDVIMCSEVLEHLEDPIGAIKSLTRLGNKKLIIGVPYKREIVDDDHIHEFDLDDIYNLLQPYGYVELSVINGNSNILACVWLPR